MKDTSIRRLTGMFGVGAATLLLLQTPLYFMYSGAPPDWNVLTRILLSLFGCALFIVFLAGFRHLICQANPRYEWVSTLAFGAGLMYVAVIMVSQSLEAGAAIVSDVPVDPTVAGPLAPGQFLMYGSIGRLITALFLTAAGFAIGRTRVLPAWTAWVAYVIALFNLAFVPSMYFGPDAARFYSAVGWGATAFAASFLFYWVLAVSIVATRSARSG